MTDKRLKYNTELREVSRKNRTEPTYAEKELWYKLLRKDKLGYRFLQQRPIGNFIVDFYCISLRLAIEVDGEIHKDSIEYDIARTEYLNELGIKVIRFSNNEILTKIESVKNDIIKSIKELTCPPF